MNLVLLIHLTALYSLYLRSGAFVLALGTIIGTIIMTLFFMTMISIGSGGRETEGLFGLAAVILGVICLGCHAIILLRMPSLGER